MKYIKRYNESIDFSKKEYSPIMVGIPSGEVIQVTYEQLDELFINNLTNYTSYAGTTGFYAFDDKNVEKIKQILNPSESKGLKDFFIKDNKFDRKIVERIIELLKEYPFDVQLMIEDYNMYISFKNSVLDVSYNDESSPRYLLILGMDGEIITKYSIPTDELLIRSIKNEIYK